MKIIRCALVGMGRISKKHIEAIEANNSELTCVAVCDSDPLIAEEAGKSLGVSFYTSLDVMLEMTPDIDLVCLCTPSGLHPEQAMLALEHGKHVVTEKPMGTDLASAQAMIEKAKQCKKQLFVVKQNRLNPTIQALKEAIVAGQFGDIYLVQANVFWCRPQAYYDQASWRGTWKMDGGAFMNQASHYVDLLEWLVGPIKRIQSMTKTLARDIQAEDSGVLNLEWENGALGSMAVTMLTYPQNLEGSITILGSKGSAKIGGIALNVVEFSHFEDTNFTLQTKLGYETDSVYGSGHTPYYKNVADALIRGAKPVADGESGLKSIKILDAIYADQAVTS